MKKLILSSVVAVAIFGGVSYAKDSYIDDAINLARDAAITTTVNYVAPSAAVATASALGATAMVGAIWGVSMMLKD